jgi:hypothetical protein
MLSIKIQYIHPAKHNERFNVRIIQPRYVKLRTLLSIKLNALIVASGLPGPCRSSHTKYSLMRVKSNSCIAGSPISHNVPATVKMRAGRAAADATGLG